MDKFCRREKNSDFRLLQSKSNNNDENEVQIISENEHHLQVKLLINLSIIVVVFLITGYVLEAFKEKSYFDKKKYYVIKKTTTIKIPLNVSVNATFNLSKTNVLKVNATTEIVAFTRSKRKRRV